MPPIPCQRPLFFLPPEEHYLNCAYMAPLLRSVEEAGIAAIRRRRNPTQILPGDFFAESDRVRTLFAELLGAASDRIALLPSVSYGLAVVARNLEVTAVDRVVVLHEQFPSNVYAWEPLLRRGATKVTVAPPEGGDRARGWNERLLDAIVPGTGLVAIPHVHWADGTKIDLVAVSRRAREVDAALVIDATQSLGALPLDFAAVAPDALICAGYKWLLGPYSTALGFFGPRFDGGIPLEETWIARRGSEDFAGLVHYQDAYAPGATRYDVGERSNFTLLPMLSAALRQVLSWGPQTIQETLRELTAPLMEACARLGFRVEPPSGRGEHLFGIRPPRGLDVRKLGEELAASRVSVSVRGEAIRVAPHVYNDAADVEALAASITRAAKARIGSTSR